MKPRRRRARGRRHRSPNPAHVSRPSRRWLLRTLRRLAACSPPRRQRPRALRPPSVLLGALRSRVDPPGAAVPKSALRAFGISTTGLAHGWAPRTGVSLASVRNSKSRPSTRVSKGSLAPAAPGGVALDREGRLHRPGGSRTGRRHLSPARPLGGRVTISPVGDLRRLGGAPGRYVVFDPSAHCSLQCVSGSSRGRHLRAAVVSAPPTSWRCCGSTNAPPTGVPRPRCCGGKPSTAPIWRCGARHVIPGCCTFRQKERAAVAARACRNESNGADRI
jgi:hypothetical protein